MAYVDLQLRIQVAEKQMILDVSIVSVISLMIAWLAQLLQSRVQSNMEIGIWEFEGLPKISGVSPDGKEVLARPVRYAQEVCCRFSGLQMQLALCLLTHTIIMGRWAVCLLANHTYTRFTESL